MMTPKYHNKFFDNALFLEWCLHRSEELDEYWRKYLQTHPEDAPDFERATEMFSRLSFNEYELDDASKEKTWTRIVSSVLQRRIRRNLAVVGSVAAAILAFVLIVVFSGEWERGQQPLNLSSDTILGETIPLENIQLISGDNIIELPESETLKVDADGRLAIQSQGDIEIFPVEFHKLIVPYGKRSVLIMSDGSKMWINSGSQVEFPSKFTDKERSVKVNGEIYVEVAKDKNRPFRIHSDDLTVTVLGTKFNFSSYDNRADKHVVLVEGAVEVSYQKEECLVLKPDQMFLCDSVGKTHVCTVDTWEYTSWKDGVFIFNQTSLHDVLEKISSYYNIKFCNNSSRLMQLTCTGRLYLSDSIDQVMNTIAVLSGTTYERKDNIIYINPKQ